MAAVNALAASMTLPHTSRLTLAATPATTTRGVISFSPYCDCSVSREVMMKPPAMTNSTKMALAVTRLVVQMALTCGLAVRFGVDRTVWPSASRTGLRPVFAIQAMKSLIALRIWPGMSNRPGSLLLSGAGGIGLGVDFGGAGVLSGLGGTPGAGAGAGVGSAHAAAAPTVTAAPQDSATPSSSNVNRRSTRVRMVGGRMVTSPSPPQP